MSLQKPLDVLTILGRVEDPRVNRTKLHALIDILFIGLVGTLCSCNDWATIERFAQAKIDWFRRFIRLKNGIPSHDALGRVFGRLKAPVLEACFKEWLHDLHEATGGGQIAIDGKTLAGSFDKSTGQSALHLLSAWSVETRVVLGQQATDQKSNEITAIPTLLEMLELKGAIVSIDAMGCQTEIAKQIHDAGGDYVLALKGNHPTMAQAVAETFVEVTKKGSKAKGVRRMTTRDKSGSKNRREYVIMPVPADLPGKSRWPGLRSIGMAIRWYATPTPTGRKGQVRFYLSSLPAKVRPFAKFVRRHWSIENTLHWSLDVNFSEDRSRIRKGEGPEVTAWLRRLVVSILKQDTSIKDNVRGKRFILGWDENKLEHVLAGFTGD